MKAITFKGYNSLVAKDQPEYLTLPALIMPHHPSDGNTLNHCVTCWELSEEEMQNLLLTRRIYITTRFKDGIPPMMASIDQEQFFQLPDDFEQPENLPLDEPQS